MVAVELGDITGEVGRFEIDVDCALDMSFGELGGCANIEDVDVGVMGDNFHHGVAIDGLDHPGVLVCVGLGCVLGYVLGGCFIA